MKAVCLKVNQLYCSLAARNVDNSLKQSDYKIWWIVHLGNFLIKYFIFFKIDFDGKISSMNWVLKQLYVKLVNKVAYV